MNFDRNFDRYGSDPVKNGTTIVGVKFDTGVIIAADSRVSCGFYITNRIGTKLLPLTNRIYVCLSGVAADAQAIVDQVALALQCISQKSGREPLVIEAAHHFRRFTYGSRGNMYAHFIVAGWDLKNGTQLYEISLGGMLNELNVATGGSGACYAAPILNTQYKTEMDKSQCSELVVNAMKTSMKYDYYSGGVIRMCCITEDGVDENVVF